MYGRARYLPAGDHGLLIEFGNEIHPDTHHRVFAMARAVEQTRIQGIDEIIPSYRSLLVAYDPYKENRKEPFPYRNPRTSKG